GARLQARHRGGPDLGRGPPLPRRCAEHSAQTGRCGRRLSRGALTRSGLAPRPVGPQKARLFRDRFVRDELAKTPMRIIYISGEPTIPSHHYRVARPIEAAARLGVHAAWMGLDELPGRADELESAAVVIVWRAPWDERLASAVNAARSRGAK